MREMTHDEAWEELKALGAQKLQLRSTLGHRDPKVREFCADVNIRIDELLQIMYPRGY